VSNFIFATLEWVTNTGLFNRKIQGSAVDIRTDFMVYKNEHNRLIDALAKAKGI
jgi:deoxycytidine triphosphate deaminase